MDRFLTFVLLFVASTTSQGIKNSPPDLTHQQYHGLQHHLSRGLLSPQQQSHIYNDVQQHRFQLAAGTAVHQHSLSQPIPEYSSFQPHQQLPDLTYQNQGFTPIKTPQVQNIALQRPNPPPQQSFSSYTQEFNGQNQHQQSHNHQHTNHQHAQQIPNYVQPLQINSQFNSFNQLPSLTQPNNQPVNNFNFPTAYLARPETPVRIQDPPARIPPTRVAAQHTRAQEPPRTLDVPSRHHHQNRVEVPSRVPEYSRNPYEELKQQKPQESPLRIQDFQGPVPDYKQQKAQELSVALPEYSRNPYEIPKTHEGPARIPDFNRNHYEEFKHPIQPLHDDRYNRKRPNTNPNQIHQYLTEVNSGFNEANRYNNYQFTTQPSFVIETQPPSTRTQKPYEAITINDDQSSENKENVQSNSATPKTVKYRIRPTKKPAEETTKKRDKTHPVLYSKTERQKLYQQALLEELGTTEATTYRTPTRRATTVQTTPPSDQQELDLQAELQKQIQEQLADKDNPYGTLKITLPGSLTPDQIANLPQLALGDAFAQLSPATQSVSGHDPSTLFSDHSKSPAPIHPTPPPTTTRKHVKNIVAESLRTTSKPPTAIFEELTKGVLPPGANFEVIRQKQDGVLEEVDKLQNLPQKKVTFVILEEQPDGSVKVKGVQGNEDQGEQDVDSIIQQLKKGEIKLPPSTRNQATPQESINAPSYVKHTTKDNNYVNKYVQDTSYYNTPVTKPPTTTAYTTYVKHSSRNNAVRNRYEDSSYYTTAAPTTTTTTPPPTTTTKGSTRGSYVIRRRRPMSTTYRPTTTTITTTTPVPTTYAYTVNSHSGPPFVTNLDPNRVNYHPNSYTPNQEYTTPAHFIPTQQDKLASSQDNTRVPTQYEDRFNQYPEQSQEYVEVSQYPDQSYTNQKNTYTEQPKTYIHQHQPKIYTEPQKAYSEQPHHISKEEHATPQDVLHDIFKSKGLYAMAKFLHQSGLDSVLNETGPYTIFVPTDKAFKTLLVQLGGPDRADQKFKENPRLLSGLLLHHVIPGAFNLGSLQDEMTGVSLAGTQLRVNTYNTQDSQWNDLKVITINGAKIVGDMADITVPQGIAHVVDRVMFPLPVGDIMQTLQADREQRFTRFIRLVQETGVADMLTGTKTYTIFAPVDGSWSDDEIDKILEHRAEARALVMRHITPGTLYSAGMHYYQLRDTMLSNKQISLFKEAGRVKANNAHVVSRNIPATNGVIHAVDGLL